MVAVLADERVVGGVFAELLQSGREDDEFAAVGDHHACAVDGLVAEPGGAELLGVEEDDDLPDGLVHEVEVDLLGESDAHVERRVVVADEESAHVHGSGVMVLSHDGHGEDDGQVGQIGVDSVVEQLADGRLVDAHEPLQPV